MTDKDYKQKEFVKVIQNNQNILHKIVNLYTNSLNDREDLYQEIIIQLWKSYPNFKGNSKLSTWIYRIALNTAITDFNKERKRKSREVLVSIKNEPGYFEKYFKDEPREQLLIAITKLSEIDRAIIMLYLEEKNYEEISNIIGIPKPNIGVRIMRQRIISL